MAPPEYHYPVYECFEDFSLWPCISYVRMAPSTINRMDLMISPSSRCRSSVLASLFALTFLIALAVLIPVLYKTRR